MGANDPVHLENLVSKLTRERSECDSGFGAGSIDQRRFGNVCCFDDAGFQNGRQSWIVLLLSCVDVMLKGAPKTQKLSLLGCIEGYHCLIARLIPSNEVSQGLGNISANANCQGLMAHCVAESKQDHLVNIPNCSLA